MHFIPPLAVGQGEKSVEVRQLKEEIAKLCSSLTNFVSRQVEGGVRKHKRGRADGGDIHRGGT